MAISLSPFPIAIPPSFLLLLLTLLPCDFLLSLHSQLCYIKSYECVTQNLDSYCDIREVLPEKNDIAQWSTTQQQTYVLFWITHPTRQLGALYKRDSFDEVIEQNQLILPFSYFRWIRSFSENHQRLSQLFSGR